MWSVNLSFLGKIHIQSTHFQSSLPMIWLRMRLLWLLVASIFNSLYTISPHMLLNPPCKVYVKKDDFVVPCECTMSQSFEATTTKHKNALCGHSVKAKYWQSSHMHEHTMYHCKGLPSSLIGGKTLTLNSKAKVWKVRFGTFVEAYNKGCRARTSTTT